MRRSDGRGCWRWDQEKEEGRGGDRRQPRPNWEEGNSGQSVPGDRCLGPSPSGYVGLGEHKETPQTQISSCPVLGAVRILFTLYQAGALRGWARRHPPSS